MNINFSVVTNPNQTNMFDHLQLTVPGDLSNEEIKEVIYFVKKYMQQKFGVTIQENPKQTPAVQRTKQITIHHFYNYLSLVKIRKGVRDLEFNFDLSELKGQILLFFQNEDEELYYIKWTRESFLKLPENYLLQLKDNELPWSGTFIESSNLLPIELTYPIESLDLILVDKYLPTLSESARTFWENQLLPLIKKHQNVLLAWENHFSCINSPQRLSYRMENSEEKEIEYSITCTLSPAGFDSIFGLWVLLCEKNEEIIIPLSQIMNFENPTLDQVLSFYKDWMQIFCPET
ncbi:MAG: hypothetical protein CL609_19735 [Anaerolineaceae bacterium]|nr:hypothetical protein [Anaerolineaceae bacterium]